jgi:hypothetical protein
MHAWYSSDWWLSNHCRHSRRKAKHLIFGNFSGIIRPVRSAALRADAIAKNRFASSGAGLEQRCPAQKQTTCRLHAGWRPDEKNT